MSRWLVGSSRISSCGASRVQSESSSRAFSPPEQAESGVSARSAFHEQESHGFSNNHAASHHDRTLAGGLDAGLLKQADAPKRRAGHKPRRIFHRKLGDIHRMEPIHILAGIDCQNDLRLVDLRRRRGLDKNAVNSRIRIEFGNEG